MGDGLPGWRLALSLEDRAIFDTATDQRVGRYLAIGSITVAVLALLALVTARTLGQQVKLARLKNDLVATVSHELKTPLTAIRALVDTLLDAEQLDEKTTREYLQLVAQENARLSRLIENFLTFSRLERNRFIFRFAAVQPGEISRAAVAALMERTQAPGCRLEVEVAEDLPPVRGDADALTTALLNLLDNACKYSGEEKRIAFRTFRQNGHVRFAVTDNGLGLAPAEQRRIFQRFYQVDQRLSRTVGGCGLGLSIVQSIVEAHDGSISVESAVGHGSTFSIEIPALKESSS
jgi:signal transduction histidine kinase